MEIVCIVTALAFVAMFYTWCLCVISARANRREQREIDELRYRKIGGKDG